MPDQSADKRKRWLELHQADWNREVKIDRYFTLHKIHALFPDNLGLKAGSCDVIYYDAFAPGAQPDLWGTVALGRCYDLLKPNGVWISYCSKGSVKRNLEAVGFELEALPGPPGKREITKAVKG